MNLQIVFGLLKRSFLAWRHMKARQFGAAIAYYSIFSIGPFLLIMLSITGAVFQRETAEARVILEVTSVAGPIAGELIETVIHQTRQPSGGLLAFVVGIAFLFFGSSGVLLNLQDGLNTAWGTGKARHSLFVRVARKRLLSFVLVLGTGFLLLISLLLSIVFQNVDASFAAEWPRLIASLKLLNPLFSWVVISVLFALIYRFLPDIKMPMRSVWLGAFFASALYHVGKYFLGLYLGNGHIFSTYGVASAFVVIMLWAYYAAQIFLFGAAFIKEHVSLRRSGHHFFS